MRDPSTKPAASASGRESANLATVQWLIVSVVLSVALTVVLNVALRAFPGASDRIGRGLDNLAAPRPENPEPGDHRVRMIVPWKAMLLASVVLTVLVNVLIRLA